MKDLKVKIFADGADLKTIAELNADPAIQGLTTNPTLMRKAGIDDFEGFAKQVLKIVSSKPISFEVFSDDFTEMHRQAIKIAQWQQNVYVKIPIVNTAGQSSISLIRKLAKSGVNLNITALMTLPQIQGVVDVLDSAAPAVLSIFAGRIADTGVDPQPIIREALKTARAHDNVQILWASVREVLNIYHADQCGCHIVTVPHDILSKARRTWGMDLDELSRQTVKMFADDAVSAGFRL